MNAPIARFTPGTHLISHRRGYDHHGIYLGNGRVIHYAGRMRYPEGLVEEVALEEFSRGRAISVSRSVAGFQADEIVLRARSRLGEHCYRVLSNNCEHFCSWCESGQSRSAQVERWTARPRAWAIALGALALQAFALASSLRSFSTVAE